MIVVQEGKVCQFWKLDFHEASLVCRSLGHSCATQISTSRDLHHYASYPAKYREMGWVVTDVGCSGDEESIRECRAPRRAGECGDQTELFVTCGGGDPMMNNVCVFRGDCQRKFN